MGEKGKTGTGRVLASIEGAPVVEGGPLSGTTVGGTTVGPTVTDPPPGGGTTTDPPPEDGEKGPG